MTKKVTTLLLFIILALVVIFKANAMKDCYAEKMWVKSECWESIKRVGDYKPPTDKCRYAVERSDMNCICAILTKHEEQTVCPKKLVRLSAECGKPIKIGYKCGGEYLRLCSTLMTQQNTLRSTHCIGRQWIIS